MWCDRDRFLAFVLYPVIQKRYLLLESWITIDLLNGVTNEHNTPYVLLVLVEETNVNWQQPNASDAESPSESTIRNSPGVGGTERFLRLCYCRSLHFQEPWSLPAAQKHLDILSNSFPLIPRYFRVSSSVFRTERKILDGDLDPSILLVSFRASAIYPFDQRQIVCEPGMVPFFSRPTSPWLSAALIGTLVPKILQLITTLSSFLASWSQNFIALLMLD